MIIFMILLLVLGGVFLKIGIGWIRDPESGVEFYKENQPSKNYTKKNVLVFGITFVITGIIIIATTLYMFPGAMATNNYQASKESGVTYSEKQMKDLGYVKENGKWNYEGGDAGQNDGRSGD